MHERDVRFDILVENQRPYCTPVQMDAEDNLFILYTSGSTGMPKGLLHTTGGYALFVRVVLVNNDAFSLCLLDFVCIFFIFSNWIDYRTHS